MTLAYTITSHYYEAVVGSPRPLSGCIPTFASMDISLRCRLPPAATVLVSSEETIRLRSQPQRRSRRQSQDSAGWNVLQQLPGVDSLFLQAHRLDLPRYPRGQVPSQWFIYQHSPLRRFRIRSEVALPGYVPNPPPSQPYSTPPRRLKRRS